MNKNFEQMLRLVDYVDGLMVWTKTASSATTTPPIPIW